MDLSPDAGPAELEAGSPEAAAVPDLRSGDTAADAAVDRSADAPVVWVEAGADAAELPADASVPVDTGGVETGAQPNGTPCTLGSACTSGHCVDGVCCDSACTGQCTACAELSSQGRCAAVNGVPRGLRGACAGQGSPCAGTCAGRSDGQCQYPTGACGARGCQGNAVVGEGICTSGSCATPSRMPCANGFCSAGACLSISAMASSSTATCVLVTDGTVRCWGEDLSGQLGDGLPKMSLPTPVVTMLNGATAVVSGGNHNCAIDGGGVKCWGLNSSGQLGDGGTTDSPYPVAVTVPTAAHASQIAASYDTTCGLVGTGVKCWGNGTKGQTGDALLATLNPTTIVGGYDHFCALMPGGTVKCWGNNSEGQLGIPNTTPTSATPVEVTGLSGATAVAAGTFSTCAIVVGGGVKCWGFNNRGQLGNGITSIPGMRSITPVSVQNLPGPVVALTGGTFFYCAVSSGGVVSCWGSGDRGQLGNGANGMSSWSGSALTVPGVAGASAVAAGSAHVCALVADGPVKCWGRDDAFQTGAPGPMDTLSPFAVTGW